MNTERAQVGWGFWLWWVLAIFAGWAIGSLVSDTVGGMRLDGLLEAHAAHRDLAYPHVGCNGLRKAQPSIGPNQEN